jgi:hypothetical protein
VFSFSLIERGHPVRLSVKREIAKRFLLKILSELRSLADRMSALRISQTNVGLDSMSPSKTFSLT